jgi:hypothetical protein
MNAFRVVVPTNPDIESPSSHVEYGQETASLRTSVLALLDSPCFSVIVLIKDFSFYFPKRYGNDLLVKAIDPACSMQQQDGKPEEPTSESTRVVLTVPRRTTSYSTVNQTKVQTQFEP